jgi:DNA polymerase-3 subunit alpha
MKPNIDVELIQIPECATNSYLKVGGIITASKKIITKKGARMFKFNIEDPTGELEIIVFPKDAKNYSDDFFKAGEIVYISGTLNRETDDENSSYRVFLSNIEKIDHATLFSGKAIYLEIDTLNSEKIQQICDIINAHNGNKQVYLKVNNNLGTFVYRFNKTTNRKAEALLDTIIL